MQLRGKMFGRLALFGSLAAAGTLWFAASDSTAQNRQPAARLPRPVVNAHVLMERFHEPLYDALHEALKKGPADKKEWRAIEHNAIRAAEVANLTAIREVPDADRDQWERLAAGSQNTALEMASAAKSMNYDATKNAWRSFVQACNACHQKFEPEHAPILEP